MNAITTQAAAKTQSNNVGWTDFFGGWFGG